jgi:hypothetical protein
MSNITDLLHGVAALFTHNQGVAEAAGPLAASLTATAQAAEATLPAIVEASANAALAKLGPVAAASTPQADALIDQVITTLSGKKSTASVGTTTVASSGGDLTTGIAELGANAALALLGPTASAFSPLADAFIDQVIVTLKGKKATAAVPIAPAAAASAPIVPTSIAPVSTASASIVPASTASASTIAASTVPVSTAASPAAPASTPA